MGTNCCDICVIIEKCLHGQFNNLPTYEELKAGYSLAACDYDSAYEYTIKLMELGIKR